MPIIALEAWINHQIPASLPRRLRLLRRFLNALHALSNGAKHLLTYKQFSHKHFVMRASPPSPGPRYQALLQLLRTAEALWNASRNFFARWDLSPSQFN